MGQNSHTPRVLVIDDEPLMRWTVQQTLSDMGCLVEEVADGADAVRLLTPESVRFDVVLLDYHLPDSHDLTLLATLRRLAPRCQIVLMTAFATPALSKGAIELGVHCVLTKPFELTELAEAVRRAYADRPQ